MKLSDRLAIDIWKVIADKVQMLRIYDFSDREFNENLVMLGKMLANLDISLDFLNRYPNSAGEVGLAALLQGIYSGNVFNDYKKANFYEKIYQLDELGIPSIQFRPVDFPACVDGISLLKDIDTGEDVGIRNCFTDGEFKIGYPDMPLNRRYDLVNLKDANYVIDVLVDKREEGIFINQDESYAILRNFNGIYPNKETLYDIRYPGLGVYSRYLDDGKRQIYLKELFYPMDRDSVNYPKKLVRMKDNYHYE